MLGAAGLAEGAILSALDAITGCTSAW